MSVISKVFFHILSPGASSGNRTLNLRMMSQVFNHSFYSSTTKSGKGHTIQFRTFLVKSHSLTLRNKLNYFLRNSPAKKFYNLRHSSCSVRLFSSTPSSSPMSGFQRLTSLGRYGIDVINPFWFGLKSQRVGDLFYFYFFNNCGQGWGLNDPLFRPML